MPLAAHVFVMVSITVTFFCPGVCVTTAVTRNVQGPITETWHTPAPAPATTPDKVGLTPLASMLLRMPSLAHSKIAPLVALYERKRRWVGRVFF